MCLTCRIEESGGGSSEKGDTFRGALRKLPATLNSKHHEP